MNPGYNEQIWQVPSMFVITKIHCILNILINLGAEAVLLLNILLNLSFLIFLRLIYPTTEYFVVSERHHL
jgi:hypothetical protein